MYNPTRLRPITAIASPIDINWNIAARHRRSKSLTTAEPTSAEATTNNHQLVRQEQPLCRTIDHYHQQLRQEPPLCRNNHPQSSAARSGATSLPVRLFVFLSSRLLKSSAARIHD